MKTFIVLLAILLLASALEVECDIYYTLPSADVTCDQIASDNNLSIEQFLTFNPDTDCSNLQAGQQVCVYGAVYLTESSYISGNEEEAQSSNGSSEESQPNTGTEESQLGNAEEESQTSNGEEAQSGNGTEEESQLNTGTEEESQSIEEEVEHVDVVEEAETNNQPEDEVVGKPEYENPPYDSVEVELYEDENHEWPEEKWPLDANLNEAAPTTGVDLFAEEVVYARQVYRSKWDCPPLTYSYDLADGSTAWARYLAKNHLFEHGDGIRPFGECLAGSYDGVFNPAYYIDQWGAEGQYYIPGCTFPDCSTTGDWANVGHYTQIIWRNVTSVGCGYWTEGDFTVWVCRYYPPGNWLEQQVV